MTNQHVEALSKKLFLQSRDTPLGVFAYGSLIWKLDFNAVGWRYGGVKGWHRSFCLRLTRTRRNQSQPGLKLVLSCNRIVFCLSEEDRLAQIQRMIRREISSMSDAYSTRWVEIDTPEGPVRALIFWAGPLGDRIKNRELQR